MALNDDVERLTRIEVITHWQGPNSLARQCRTACNLKGSEIGKVCGVAESTIYEWERGAAQPTTQQALAWMDFLTQRLAAARVRAAEFQETMPHPAPHDQPPGLTAPKGRRRSQPTV